MSKKLIGCINTLTWKTIKTRWFYLDKDNNICKDVTKELALTIDNFNRRTNNYSRIPFEYKNGLTKYSFGCGLSHYLQEDLFKDLSNLDKSILSFDLTKCKLNMFCPKDIKHILKCKNAWSINIEESLLKNI
ncbi:hypothetical protein EJM73_09210 [Clostridium botulinum]|uniref:hypothetical protein n=1 Tax=Clostridium botulinum TaxID=1491 RepID=UPI001375ECF5|nr:hypothetical protein [Clostridium botulinum]NCI19804.1 hypothetical protein [Clostridium botulinum]NCI35842.1 hypothetical protein [Clostridium botulinum]NCI71699.1 hypothetical protein [Clostridium botulinum]NDI38891.1 hypothetical protein [Clostridium botulinum]